MDRGLLLRLQWVVIIALIALLAAPYIVARSSQTSMGDMNMSSGVMQQLFPLDSAGVPIPTVSFTLTQGAPDGWYLHIITTNFTFTPDKINTAPVADEGHAHLYIDGALTVVMGPWFHIDTSAVPPGKHTITVVLAGNDHSEFAYKGKTIEATETLYAY